MKRTASKRPALAALLKCLEDPKQLNHSAEGLIQAFDEKHAKLAAMFNAVRVEIVRPSGGRPLIQAIRDQGEYHQFAGQHAEAETCFLEALDLMLPRHRSYIGVNGDGLYIDCLDRLADSLEEQKKLPDAIGYWQFAIDLLLPRANSWGWANKLHGYYYKMSRCHEALKDVVAQKKCLELSKSIFAKHHTIKTRLERLGERLQYNFGSDEECDISFLLHVQQGSAKMRSVSATHLGYVYGSVQCLPSIQALIPKHSLCIVALNGKTAFACRVNYGRDIELFLPERNGNIVITVGEKIEFIAIEIAGSDPCDVEVVPHGKS